MSTPSLSYSVNGSTVTLTWSQITNAESYEVWRSTGGGTFIKLISTTNLTYTDFNLAPLTYSYKVKAVTQCDCSKDSNTVEVTITGGSSSISPALYYHEDHLGTIRLITDGSGTIVSIHDYEPFGTEIPPLSYSENTHRFTGHERDSATGNDYMINRFYSAGMGRFTRTDPVGGTASDPQSWNMYAYVSNNPIGSVDPLGLTGGDYSNLYKWGVGGDTGIGNYSETGHMAGSNITATKAISTTAASNEGVPNANSQQQNNAATLVTDMTAGTTTLTRSYPDGTVVQYIIDTSNDVVSGSLPNSQMGFVTTDVYQKNIPNNVTYGPTGSYIEVGTQYDIHGGGTKLGAGAFASNQPLVPTAGCTRGHNEDVKALGGLITAYKAQTGNNVSYARVGTPPGAKYQKTTISPDAPFVRAMKEGFLQLMP